jgi:carboxypeptidase family protein
MRRLFLWQIGRVMRCAGWAVAIWTLAIWGAALLPGQVAATGALSGHVRGPGGASVPGATVQVTELQSGERKVTWTDDRGDYLLTGLNPGTYKLEVSLVGFRTDTRQPVPITTDKVLKANVALVIAVPEESMQASAHTPARGDLQALPPALQARLQNFAMEAGSSQNGGAGGETTIRFAGATAEGTTSTEESSAEGGEPSASAANSFLLSGGTGQTASTPSGDENRQRERWREFRDRGGQQGAPGFGGGGPDLAQMATFMAGRGGDWARRRAQINRVRGNVFARYSNSALNAHPYPLNVAESPQIASHSEQFGFSLGGPLVIPKIYHGRDKTSFFVHYNLERQKAPFDNFATVPTLAERAGDFSQAVVQSGPLAGTVPTIYNPFSNPAGPRTPFPGNRIPSTMFDTASLGLLKYIPLPNLPGLVQNFHLQEALPSSNDRVMGRVGHQISKKDSLNAFYFFNSSRSTAVSSFPELTRSASVRGQNLSLGENHTFSPTLLNTLSVNFNRQRNSILNPFAFQADIAAELGVHGVSTNPFDWGLPITQFTNFSSLNDTIPSLTRNQTTRVFDFLIWNVGKHNIRLGGEVRRVQINTLTDPDARGTFTFSGFATSDFTGPGLPVSATGIDFADFLLGLPQTTSVRFGTTANYFRSWVYSGFFQDDWRITSHLTLNYGFRYEYFVPFTEKYGHLSDLEFGPGFSNASVVTSQNPGALPASLIRGAAKNFAPRLGLAYRPWSGRRVVLRAGYGIFYDGSIYNRLFPNLANQPPFAQAATLLTTPQHVLTLENGFPEVGPNILRNTYAVDPNFRTPYAQSWNFGVEDEIARDVILSLGYVGTKGTKLDLLLAPNQFRPGASPAGGQQLALRNALAFTYETFGAASIYHGLQVGLRRQFHGGFSMSGNYTFSKSIDNAASVGGSARTVAQNYLDLQAERGLSVFDVRHRLLINHTYEFPWGDGRRWLSHGGAWARVVGNWQVSGVTTIQSGIPYTAQVRGNLSNFGGAAAIFNLRADATGQPVDLASPARTTQNFFNTAAFSLPQAGQFGNAGRNTIPGPGMVNFNMSLERFVTISKEKGIRGTFEVNANNIFNTPNFNGLATVVNAQDFGRITSVKNMRTLAVALRLRF